MGSSRGEIVSETLRALRRTLSTDDKAAVERYVNRFYFDLCRTVPVKALRRQATIDLSDADSDGSWLPSDMTGIFGVVDVDDGFEYVERDKADVDTDESSYRYFTFVPSGGALFIGNDLELTRGSTSFTSSELTEDYTGYYVKFGDEPGVYLLTAAKEFSPAYGGPTLSQVQFVVRPNTTNKIVCLDPSEEMLVDRSVYVNYLALPTPLYNDTDVPVLPSTRALELLVMKEAMWVIGKRQLSGNAYDRDIKDAMDELRKLCPPIRARIKARDMLNRAFSFEKQIFSDRDE